MYYVWVDFPSLKVAGADSLEMALYYAAQYVDEGVVSVRHKNRLLMQWDKGFKDD